MFCLRIFVLSSLLFTYPAFATIKAHPVSTKYREEPVRWGILGTAKVAQDHYVDAIQKDKNGELVAVASRIKASADTFASKNQIPKAYGSYQELLDDKEIDAVYIPLPNTLHLEWATKAANAAKHILIEKPLALTSFECEEIIKACQQNYVFLMEALMYRYHPQMEKVRELLKNQAISDPTLIRISYSEPTQIKEGALAIKEIYAINFIREIFGDPLSVTAVKMENPRYPGVDASLFAILTFSGGKAAIIDASLELDKRQIAEIVGSDGRIVIPEPFDTEGVYPTKIQIDKRAGLVKTSLIETIPTSDRYELEIKHMNQAIKKDQQPETGGVQALKVLRILEAISESATNGKKITLFNSI